MKKLFSLNLLLAILLPAAQKCLAQAHAGSKHRWNQTIEIELEKKQKLIVSSNVSPLIMHAAHVRFDTLKAELENWIQRAPVRVQPLNSATYLLLHEPGRGPELMVFEHETTTKAYTLHEGEVAALKISQDSVIFSYTYSELPADIRFNSKYKDKLPRELVLNYCFVLNRIENLEDLDAEYLLNQIRSNINRIDDKISDASLYGNPEMKIESGNTLNLSWDYKTQDFLAITGRASGGWVREKFVPELGVTAELILKGKYGLGIGVNQFFHFKNAAEKNFSVSSSTFANLQFSLRKLETGSTNGINKVTTESLITLSAGYMVRDKSGFFPKNTWRISATLPVMKHLYVEPELFFNDAFKRLYPGIRFKIM